MAEVTAPTIGDARRAGRALAAAGAREVLLFGSVAKGSASRFSDIDLVVMLDDVDYHERRLATSELARLAADAAGQPVDMWVTDLPEWTAQKQQASSFVAAIQDDLVPVAVGNGDDRAVRWDKEQVMPENDTEAAYRRLSEALTQLNRLSNTYVPGERERGFAAAGLTARQEEFRADLLVQACSTAAMAIESALRALGSVAGIDPRAMHSHDVARIAAELPGEDREAARQLVLSDEVRDFWSVSVWRTLGDYLPVTNGHQAKDLATADFASSIGAAAASMAEYASNKIARLHGRRTVNDSIAQILRELRDVAEAADTAPGEQTQPAGPDDGPAAEP